MKGRHSGKSLCASVAALALLTAASPSYAENYIANVFLPPAQPLGMAYAAFAESVKEASKGRINFEVHAGGSLLPPKASLEGIRNGVTHVGFVAGTYTPADLPLNNIIADLTLSNPDAMVTAFASTDFNINNPAMQAEWKKNGVVYGAGYSTAAYRIMCRGDTSKMTDLKGKKIRVPGGLWDRLARQLGGTPVNISSEDMYSGLDRGSLDCVNNDASALRDRSLWDVAKTLVMVDLGFYFSGVTWGYNAAFWAKLTPQDRRLLFDQMAINMVKLQINTADSERKTIQDAAGKGVKVVEPEPALKEAIAKFAAADLPVLEKLAQEKFKVANPKAVIDGYSATVEKWTRLLKNVDRRDQAALVRLAKSEIFDKVDVASYGVK